MTLSFLFLIVALVLFILAAIGVSTRIHLGWLGLACLTAATISVSGLL